MKTGPQYAILILIIIIAAFFLSGCKEKNPPIIDDSGSTQEQAAAQDSGAQASGAGGTGVAKISGDGAETASQQEETAAQDTSAAQETAPAAAEETTYALAYSLSQLNEFLPNMDYLIGSKAPASDVITVANMKTMLIYKGIETGEAKLTGEVPDYKRDEYIIIGSPCDNPAAADMFSSDIAKKGKCKIFSDGEGVIKLKAISNNHFMLYIGGNTYAETKKAAEVVKNFGNYSLSGTEIRVTGTLEAPVLNVVQQ